VKRLAVALSCLALAASGCGDDDSATSDTTEGKGAEKIATTSEPLRDPSERPAVENSGEANERPQPKVYVPDDSPPEEMEVEDVIEGKGPVLELGDRFRANFVAVKYLSGEVFESSWQRPRPTKFDLIEGEIPPALLKGLPGMKEGGRRQLIVPGRLGALSGLPPVSDPDESALVYVVDLIEVKYPAAH
jgi:FKBP-type peptidyl-prolyl cis-trans isomerase